MVQWTAFFAIFLLHEHTIDEDIKFVYVETVRSHGNFYRDLKWINKIRPINIRRSLIHFVFAKALRLGI